MLYFSKPTYTEDGIRFYIDNESKLAIIYAKKDEGVFHFRVMIYEYIDIELERLLRDQCFNFNANNYDIGSDLACDYVRKLFTQNNGALNVILEN